MIKSQIIALQVRIGAVPDGFWGPMSIASCQTHLRLLMPKPTPWPLPGQSQLRMAYGAAGNDEMLTSIELPFPMFYEGQRVRTTRVHEDCAESLLRVFRDILNRHGNNSDIMDLVGQYGGCFCDRNKRGGTTKSLHAWGAAIDLAPDSNPFRASWPLQATMPIEVMECFAREGWISAGAFWGYDAMHFQATQ